MGFKKHSHVYGQGAAYDNRVRTNLCRAFGRHLECLIVEGDFKLDFSAADFAGVGEGAEWAIGSERDVVAADFAVFDCSFVLSAGDGAGQSRSVDLEHERIYTLGAVRGGEFGLPFACDVRRRSQERESQQRGDEAQSTLDHVVNL